VSGVPGLGCSVSQGSTDSVMKLWEEGSDEIKDKLTVSDRLVKFFSFRRKKCAQPALSSSKYSSVSLPKVSVRRSVSVVTASHRTKVFSGFGDESCQNIHIINSKSNIRRVFSFHNEKMKEKVDLHSVSKTSTQNLPSTREIYLPSSNVGNSGHRKLLRRSEKGNVIERNVNERNKVTNICQATQTDMFENDKDYDYVYRWAILNNKSHVLILILSNHISPAILIKLSEQLEEKNIYEEIISKDRKIGRANSLFSSISEGRRKQLQMNKFAGWDLDLVMGDSVDKVGG
jgi:hypothetical protein